MSDAISCFLQTGECARVIALQRVKDEVVSVQPASFLVPVEQRSTMCDVLDLRIRGTEVPPADRVICRLVAHQSNRLTNDSDHIRLIDDSYR